MSLDRVSITYKRTAVLKVIKHQLEILIRVALIIYKTDVLEQRIGKIIEPNKYKSLGGNKIGGAPAIT